MKFNEDMCGYCGACVSVCPLKIIEHDEWHIKINDGCEKCGRCTIVCPLGAIKGDI